MSTSLKLNRAQLDKLARFLRAHPAAPLFLAKDQGAYFGSSVPPFGPDDKAIFYFPGCDPDKDDDWYDTARAQFGGDDFGENFDHADVLSLADNPACVGMVVTVTKTHIRISELLRKEGKR